MPEIPPFAQLLYDVSGPTCRITLNRPERRNALSAQLVNELIVALETADSDPGVRVVVLTGAGGCFCSGGDLSQLSGSPGGESAVPWRGGFVELNQAFASLGKPVIARIERHAHAGALALVCGSHFAIAEDSAKFSAPEIDRGLFPMMVMASLFRTVPRRRGLELVLTGRRFSATEAEAMGLVSRSVPAADLDAEVDRLAAELACKSPAAMRLGLEAWRHQQDLDFAAALPYLEQMLGRVLSTDDAREGLTAFLQKREPAWSGR